MSGSGEEAIDLSGDGGVLKTIITPGVGDAFPPKGSEVFVHYVGTLADGTKFDSSRDRGQEFTFTLGTGGVIKGWDLGVATMKRGEKAMLVCRAEYAYGAQGSPPTIPPGATLNFEVELFRWKDDSDLFGDGKVTKKVISAGDDWKNPEAGSYAQITYVVRAVEEDGAVLDNSHETSPFEVTEISKSLADDCVLSQLLLGMKQGDKAEFTVHPPYKLGHGIDYPKDVPVRVEISLLLHGKIEDLSKDGRVLKKTVKAGNGWELATDGANVTFHFRVLSTQREVLHDSREGGAEPLKAVAGAGDYVEAMDFILTNLKVDEIAEFTVDASMGYNSANPPPPNVPENAPLIFEVEMISIAKGKESWNMSVQDKVEMGTAKKEHGNVFFKSGNYGRAIRYYEAVVKLFPDPPKGGGAQSDKDKEAMIEGKPIKMACLLNCAACHIKRHDWKHAAKTCDKALALDPRNVKGLFRSAQANIELENFYEAKRALNEVLLIEPDNTDAVRELKRLRLKQSQRDDQDKKTFAAMFGKK